MFYKEFENSDQLLFYEQFLPRVDPHLSLEDVLSDNNDGVINGNLLEFKVNPKNLYAAEFQCIKYLSARRIKGKPVPATFIIVDTQSQTAWCFNSEAYLDLIEQVYSGAASKNNASFVGRCSPETMNYGSNNEDAERLIAKLKQKKFTKIHIDENCVVGWARAYYQACPNARKEDFIGDESGVHKKAGEIRHPRIFKDYIYPYQGETNIKFQYLMDKLNDNLLQKNLGAFYTPKPYVIKAQELLMKAIARVPKGNDYIIIDRCAGTGNLEFGLPEEVLSHVIVSTVEYYEYKVLLERIGSVVYAVIPPFETTETFNAGLVTGADALSKEYLENSTIQKFVKNNKYTIILFENPPFIEPQAVEGQSQSPWKDSYIVKEMKKVIKGSASNELGNVFIWSGFKYYLRQPTDSYVVYSPVKYWKAQHLVNKQFLGGFAFNRRHFHTNIDACIMCALWSNEDHISDEIFLDGYDIISDSLVKHPAPLPVKKIYHLFSQQYYDKRSFPDDLKNGIIVGGNGLETLNKSRVLPLYNENLLGYMIANSSGFDKPDLKSLLVVAGCYQGNGFFLRRDNYLLKLPMFAASRYITYNREWTERGRIMKSADGSVRFYCDVERGLLSQFLLKCLLFTCLEMQNHMRTFIGSDGRAYRNELCLDISNGPTLASEELIALQKSPDEVELFDQWNKIIALARKTDEYNSSLTYGVFQISKEIDRDKIDEKTGESVPKYRELHTALLGLKNLLSKYFNTQIVPFLFEYEFLK